MKRFETDGELSISSGKRNISYSTGRVFSRQRFVRSRENKYRGTAFGKYGYSAIFPPCGYRRSALDGPAFGIRNRTDFLWYRNVVRNERSLYKRHWRPAIRIIITAPCPVTSVFIHTAYSCARGPVPGKRTTFVVFN